MATSPVQMLSPQSHLPVLALELELAVEAGEVAACEAPSCLPGVGLFSKAF